MYILTRKKYKKKNDKMWFFGIFPPLNEKYIRLAYTFSHIKKCLGSSEMQECAHVHCTLHLPSVQSNTSPPLLLVPLDWKNDIQYSINIQ